MLKVLVGYPSANRGFVIVERNDGSVQAVQRVLTTEQLVACKKPVDQVFVDPAADGYAVHRSPPPEAGGVGLENLAH